MSWYEFYDESEIIADHTKGLSKIWDNLMPTTYPYVLEFKTKRAVEAVSYTHLTLPTILRV